MNITESPDSNSSQKSFDVFQRRKIGSIRDNNKLFKILQQFENGGKEDDCSLKSTRGDVSCPSSISTKRSSGNIFPFNFNDTKDVSNSAQKSSLVQCRRHSEGEGKRDLNQLLDSFTRANRFKDIYKQNWKTSAGLETAVGLKNGYMKTSQVCYDTRQKENHQMDAKFSTVGDSYSSRTQHLQTVKPDSRDGLNEDNPPPIPKRGLSIPVTSLMQDNPISTSSTSSSSSTKSSQGGLVKQDSVKRTIEMYEGLSSKDIRNHKSGKRNINYPQTSFKPYSEHSGKRNSLARRSSKRNSFRTSKNSVQQIKHANQQKLDHESRCYQYSKEDSGVGFSDTEDLKSPEGIYQSLSTVTAHTDNSDTYDRLNRIHDMVNRIHKGQSSNCAACKAVPIGPLSPSIGPSVHQVQCNEPLPHHHPPCICFSCQHSVFSCSQRDTPSTVDVSLHQLSLEEDLYYNVCCLNKPNCEGWRRSRRRPVCEQNGRLCVVNCDMEKKSEDSEFFYEKIFEWNTKRSSEPQAKFFSGDSCDSDEGWVDVTDSEDEKTLPGSCDEVRSKYLGSSNTLSPHESNKFFKDNSKLQERIYSKIGNENMSRAASSEHLYESIADLEAQNNNGNTVDAQSKVVTDNEPDSGEWSTESSPSPTPAELSSSHHKIDKKSPSTSNSSRFTVASDLEHQDFGAKKTFIKSMLGKKTVSPKKRRMSHFFVPWLIANQEYTSSRSPKSSIKKQKNRKSSDSFGKTTKALTKNQRSQSIPLCSAGTPLSVTKMFSSTDVLDCYQTDSKELGEDISGKYSDSAFGLSAESIDSLSQRGSLASSTYINTDQLQSTPTTTRQKSVFEDSAVTDVSVEKVFRRSTSADSVHSYIVFHPIKEEEVPLYQFYERNMKERVAHCRSPECLSPIMWSMSSHESGCLSHDCQKTPFVKPQLSVLEQLSPDTKDIKMLWCELPEVKESGILARISAQELKLQEAAFEFIQSQASFIRSLKVLYEYFICVPEFTATQSSFCVLSKHEHDVLFSDVTVVKEVSERLMAELTTRWSDGILIPDICDIIYAHASMPSFSVYVKYCSNRIYQERTLKELKETRLCFLEVLRKLESNPACQGLSLESFLFLPMQHIARLPLLLDNIFRWLSPDSPSFDTCKMALEAIHKTFMECNDRARKMERLEEMFILNKQLEFKECKVVPLISASRWLLKKGELVKLEFDKKTFGRSNRCLRIPLYIFLFNDLLVVTKRKSEDSYSVLDYCLRDKVHAMAVDPKDVNQPDLVPSNCRFLLYLTLFSNHQGSAIDIVLNCTLQSERTRWIEAIHPIPHGAKTEIWEDDSPQVQCVRSYIAQQPDELSLQESDVVTIQRKMNDGWYEGRRLRDGLQGWFPASYTMDIPCSRARASNLRQCYRLLMLSQKHEACS